ncbi:MAG TPA: hypothetical protein VLE73_00845 [Candidatus Saccharimonadales bacterium]|nr:hypothetical protein [Candidatus Saccharimonadales bacterium]
MTETMNLLATEAMPDMDAARVVTLEGAPAPSETVESAELKQAFDKMVQGIDDAYDQFSTAEKELLANRTHDKSHGVSDNGTHRTKV